MANNNIGGYNYSYTYNNGNYTSQINVINGVGSFNFNLSDYSDSNNVIEISVGSSNDLHRYYTAFYSQKVTVPLI